jgi:hypothetical protein
MAKTLKSLQKDVGYMVSGGVMGSIGTSAITKVSTGTSIATTAPKGVANVMGQMPMLGTIVGTGSVLGAVREYMPKYPARAKKYRR